MFFFLKSIINRGGKNFQRGINIGLFVAFASSPEYEAGSLLYSEIFIKNNPTNMSALNYVIHPITDKIIA